MLVSELTLGAAIDDGNNDDEVDNDISDVGANVDEVVTEANVDVEGEADAGSGAADADDGADDGSETDDDDTESSGA